MLPVREAALKILLEIETKQAYANLALKNTLKEINLSKKDRALVTELVYGTVKTKNTLDWALDKFVKKGLDNLPKPIYLLLRMGAYQLIYLDRIPHAVAVSETVQVAKKYGHRGTVSLTNGVLRNLARNLPLEFPDINRDMVRHLSLKYYHPEWMVHKWLQELGQRDTELLLQANNTPPDTCLRTNTLKVTRDELLEILTAEGLAVEKSSLTDEGLRLKENTAIDELDSYRRGLFQVQAEGSMIISGVLFPNPGSTVIDACAAPGGKTTNLAQLMLNQGKVWAWDVHPHKLKLIDANCRRLGIDIVASYQQNAAEPGREWYDKADFILVDAPCSGLGVLNRRPDARWRKTPAQFEELHQLQVRIVAGAQRCLKPGGVLVYSTCSLAPEENEQVVAEILDRYPELHLEDLTPFLYQIPPGTEEEVKQGRLQLLPHRDGTDGFFLARFRKSNRV